MQARLQTEFAKAGMQRMTVDGMTVYLSSQTWATYPQGREAAVDALRRAGFAEYVKEDFNHQSVSALLRELTGDGGGGLPEEFAETIDTKETFAVKAVAS